MIFNFQFLINHFMAFLWLHPRNSLLMQRTYFTGCSQQLGATIQDIDIRVVCIRAIPFLRGV